MATHRRRRSHRRQAREPLSIPLIFSAMTKTLENAQELIEDADLLLSHNRYPRAYALAHLAREELIKCVLLFPAAMELARDHHVDWEEIDRRLRDHQAKISGTLLVDFFILNPPPDGVYQASELSQRMNTVQDINDAKNYSLYASQIDHEFFKPSELVGEQAARTGVSDAHNLLQVTQTFYLMSSTLTGLTEEGLRRCMATPAFQGLFQFLGANADLSHFPVVSREQAMVATTAVFNDPALQDVVVQFSPLFGQVLQSPNQSNGDDPQASNPTSDHSQEGILRPEQ